MAVLIFRLNGVSDEEAQDIRNLLADSALDSYETVSYTHLTLPTITE